MSLCSFITFSAYANDLTLLLSRLKLGWASKSSPLTPTLLDVQVMSKGGLWIIMLSLACSSMTSKYMGYRLFLQIVSAPFMLPTNILNLNGKRYVHEGRVHRHC